MYSPFQLLLYRKGDDLSQEEAFDENEMIREEIKELQANGIENLEPVELEILITR